MRGAKAHIWLESPISFISPVLLTGLVALSVLLVACSPSVASSVSTLPPAEADGLLATPVPANQIIGTPSKTTPIVSASIPASIATSAAQATVQAPIAVWWPDTLYPDASSNAANVLRSQLETYQQSSGQAVLVREKRSDGVGGIFQTLKSGSVAAPASMPDVVLLHRSDLIQAVAGKLVQPIDLTTLAVGDIYPSALALGQVNGVQYGVPYTLGIDHFLYRVSAFSTPPTVSSLLNAVQPILFPAGADTDRGVSSILLSQYVAAGGRLADDKGVPILDKGPLQSILSFYEQATTAKVVMPSLIDFTSAEQYWPTFMQGKVDFLAVNSTLYLRQSANLSGVALLPILTVSATDTPVTSVDGWLWAIATPDAQRQLLSEKALAWLMQAKQQAAFTEALGMLPSRHAALAAWTNQGYATFADTILAAKAIPPADLIDPAVAKALQTAFEDVLNRRKSADAASSDAVGSLNSGQK